MMFREREKYGLIVLVMFCALVALSMPGISMAGAFGAANGAPVTLGSASNTGTDAFDGLIDEVRLTDRVDREPEQYETMMIKASFVWTMIKTRRDAHV